MGIKYLNQYLCKQCSNAAIHNIHLKDLENRVIVVDASIYLYKFLGDNALIEHMYLFIAILLEYNITPIFIFDGKPPPEKRELLLRRMKKKKEAEEQYQLLQKTLPTLYDEEKQEALLELNALKKQFIRLRDNHLNKVKRLLDAYGVTHYEAPSEADILCAYLVKKEIAYACISDDMDMFLFGCPRVIRNISLLKHSGKIYETELILKEFDISPRHFREILVLSGTDYNVHSETTLQDSFYWFSRYREYKNETDGFLEFYVWLMKNTKIIQDFATILRTDQLFQFQSNTDLDVWCESIANLIKTRKKNIMDLHDILHEDGFIFV
jgi:hypothetical protein